LRVTAERGDLPLLRLLIERGAEVNGGGEFGWTPLAAAALANHALRICGTLTNVIRGIRGYRRDLRNPWLS
jgi:ankyrin repeat protein